MVVKHPLFPNGIGTPSFVLDVSITLVWIMPTSMDWYSSRVLSSLVKVKPVVPESWILHLAERLLTAERRGTITSARITSKLATLRGYPILFDDETKARAWYDILDLARMHSLTVYAAAYLELSLRLKLPLATIDATLTRAATSAGATLFTP